MNIQVPVKTISARSIIIKTGLLAGTLDICSACIQYYIRTGKNPANVLRFVASGLFGKTALAGGTVMAATGLLLHYIVAFIWTIIFFMIYPRIISLFRSTIVTGIVYGIFVWMVMNLVILPLSAAPAIPFKILNAITAALILIFAIGIPISLMISRYYRQKI